MSLAEILVVVRFAVISIGMIGNVISFVVFLQPTFKTNSISTYCQALALFECHIVWQFVMDIGDVFYSTTYADRSTLVCKINFYVLAALTTIPGWILVAFSIDKLLCMSRQQRTFGVLKKKWFQWTVVGGIVLVNLALFVEIPIMLELEPYSRGFYCDLATLADFTRIVIVYLLESAIVPFLIMIVTSIVMIVLIFKSRRNLERAGKIDRQRRSRDVKFAISSVVFNLIFIVFKCPVVVVYLLAGNGNKLGDVFLNLAMLLFFANSCICFFVHALTNSLFRRELLVLVRCRRLQSRVEPSNTSNQTQSVLFSRK